MMVEESLLTIGLFCWLFLRVARENEERQALLDYAGQHGLELDEPPRRPGGRRRTRRRAVGAPAPGAAVPGRAPAGAERRRRRRALYFAAVDRKLTSAVISSWLQRLAEVGRHHAGLVARRDVRVGLDDRGLDALLQRRRRGSVLDCGRGAVGLQVADRGWARRSRWCPAAASVWQLPQPPTPVNTGLAGRRGGAGHAAGARPARRCHARPGGDSGHVGGHVLGVLALVAASAGITPCGVGIPDPVVDEPLDRRALVTRRHDPGGTRRRGWARSCR